MAFSLSITCNWWFTLKPWYILDFVFFFFLPSSWHVEVPRPGTEPEPQLQLALQLWQHQILNPPRHKGASLTLYSFFFFFCYFKATFVAYGGSQAMSWVGATAAGLCHSQQKFRIWAKFVTYATAHGNAGSLTHLARLGITPASSRMLVRFVNRWATKGTPTLYSWF